MSTTTKLKKTGNLLIKKANELLKPYDITHAYTYFLLELYKNNGQRQTDMYKVIRIEQPTAVRTLDRMERDGLIYREHCPHDRRATLIKLTPKGRGYKTNILDCAAKLSQIAFNNFNKKDKEFFDKCLSKILDNLEDKDRS